MCGARERKVFAVSVIFMTLLEPSIIDCRARDENCLSMINSLRRTSIMRLVTPRYEEDELAVLWRHG
jgi:hypothetical protein